MNPKAWMEEAEEVYTISDDPSVDSAHAVLNLLEDLDDALCACCAVREIAQEMLEQSGLEAELKECVRWAEENMETFFPVIEFVEEMVDFFAEDISPGLKESTRVWTVIVVEWYHMKETC